MGFASELVHPVGSIELLLTTRSIPKQVTVMVKFLLVDCPSAYNTIIGRTILNQLEVVTSTPHFKMKFPIENGVREVRGDQWVTQNYYNMTLKDAPKRDTSEVGCSTRR
jgi:hypothetical protein